MKVSQRELITAAAAGGTVFAVYRYGLMARVPAIGPIGGPIVAIAAGVALVAALRHEGTVGAVVEGAGYGLIAAGVAALAAAAE